MIGRGGQPVPGERGAFLGGKRRRRKAFARDLPFDASEVEPAMGAQEAEHHGAPVFAARCPGGRGAVAERVEDEIADRAAVLRAGEAVGQPPVLQSVGNGAAAIDDVVENLDGGGNTGYRRHSFKSSLPPSPRIGSHHKEPADHEAVHEHMIDLLDAGLAGEGPEVMHHRRGGDNEKSHGEEDEPRRKVHDRRDTQADLDQPAGAGDEQRQRDLLRRQEAHDGMARQQKPGANHDEKEADEDTTCKRKDRCLRH